MMNCIEIEIEEAEFRAGQMGKDITHYVYYMMICLLCVHLVTMVLCFSC